jgi:hypothetical protein
MNNGWLKESRGSAAEAESLKALSEAVWLGLFVFRNEFSAARGNGFEDLRLNSGC